MGERGESLTDTQILAAIERCDQELNELAHRSDVIGGRVPAWLVTLGVEDWERERRAIYALLSREVWPYVFEPAHQWGTVELQARATQPCRLYRLVEHSLMVWVEFPDGHQALAMREEVRPRPVRSCRVCGCTDGDCRGCIERTGYPCSWVDADLCSACAVARCTDCGVAVGGQQACATGGGRSPRR